MTGECFLCGNYETVERHHLFGGPFRKKADRLKLTVMLCPWCHQIDPDSAHKSAETRLYLHKYGQQKAMREQGWSVEDFVREFGKNYLEIAQSSAEDWGSPDGDAISGREPCSPRRPPSSLEQGNSFKLLKGAELPW